MTKAVRSLIIGLLIVTHIAEFGSVALFVWHVQSGSTATIDHFALIELVCGAGIILDCWLLLVLFELARSNTRMDMLLWLALVLTAIVFPAMHAMGVSPTESPYLAATTQRLSMLAVLPVAAWLVKFLWKQPKVNTSRSIVE
jgi:hypothetical protein